MAQIKTGVAAGLGALGAVAARDRLDQSGNTALTRPSVLAGVGLGGLAVTSAMAVNRGLIPSPFGSSGEYQTFAYAFGYPALAVGLWSAFMPKGTSGFQTPTLA